MHVPSLGWLLTIHWYSTPRRCWTTIYLHSFHPSIQTITLFRITHHPHIASRLGRAQDLQLFDMLALILAVTFLARLAQALVSTGGSCTMTGALAQCLTYDASKGCDYAAYDACAAMTSLHGQAECYCTFFQNQADCWGQGTCCTEWPAHSAVATDICNYSKSCKIKKSILNAKVQQAYGVVMQTCHNNCGTDIPCISSEPPPKNGQDANGNCQPRSYWDNGVCSRHVCGSNKMMLL